MITFRVLGPLTAADTRGPVDLKGPRHRAVLARLLIARGRAVPVGQLVTDLWVSPPAGAVGAVQTFVAALRKSLEPDRPPRTPARILVTAPPGYALRADAVDAWDFETAVTSTGGPEQVLSRMDRALALWRGPAYAEFADEPWARGEIARLDELRLLATERRAAALLDLGRAASAVPELEAHVEDHPWREDAWRLLALARYRAGRQGDALETLRRARTVLAEELGVDPGPDLRQLEADILAQAPRLAGSEVRSTALDGRDLSSQLVGRVEELAQLSAAATTVRRRERMGLVLVAGEAGAGKTALAEAFGAHLAAQSWTVTWGASPDDDGLPAAWPWIRILDALPGPSPEPDPAGDPAAARFHWHRSVAAHLARHTPLLVVLDDLHWAGEETLALLASLVGEPGAVLIVGTYRTTDVPGRLTDFLGRAARAEPTRVYLGGLSIADTTGVVSAITGRDVDPATARLVHQRSGGNPFFVRELARVLAAGGDLSSVPAGVRDVVRYRLADLPDAAQAVLRHAAVLGEDVDLELLDDGALDALEVATARGFLVEVGPGRFRFAHALVRDTLYQDLSRSRRARWHAAIAETLERSRPGDVEALAHHFLHAEDPATAAKGARYARAAAEQAERRFASHQAARLWQAALDHTGDDPRERLTLIMGLVRALAVSGALTAARRHRWEALDLAETVGDPALTAQVIAAFDVPASWTESDDPELARRIVEVTERTLASLPPSAVRSRLLSTVALELRSTGGAHARAAAAEAETIARGLDDPSVLAFALNARFMQSFETAGRAPERRHIGTELVELASRHALVTFEVLGDLILVQANAALADFTTADAHATAATRLGEDYDLPLVSVLIEWYQAMRAMVAGRPAEAAYRAAASRLADTGMSGMSNGLLGLALLCERVHQDRAVRDDDFGGYAPWCDPLVLLAAGDVAGARNVNVPPSPRDLLFETRTCLHALAAIQLEDRPTMERLYADLTPAADELAGAGSGLVTLGPVAHYLGELATALGRDASHHHEQAARIRKRLSDLG